MGLFDFVADMGKKIFGGDDDPAEKIQASVEEDNPGVSDLEVTFENGVVQLSGSAASAEAVEKAVLLAGNIQGVTEVKIEGMDAPAPEPAVKYYTIEKGDTLWKIAQDSYGNGNDYQKLFEANKEVIKDPDKIYPGQKIRVPPKTW